MFICVISHRNGLNPLLHRLMLASPCVSHCPGWLYTQYCTWLDRKSTLLIMAWLSNTYILIKLSKVILVNFPGLTLLYINPWDESLGLISTGTTQSDQQSKWMKYWEWRREKRGIIGWYRNNCCKLFAKGKKIYSNLRIGL